MRSNRARGYGRMVGIVLLLAGAAGVARAHEFWIEPSTFRPSPRQVVALGVRVGERFDGEPVARSSERIERFVVAGPGGVTPVPGVDGADPAGFLRPNEPGLHVVGYHGRPTFIEIRPRHFETYLLEEGLDAIVADRRRRGERDTPGRERYSRCAKALLVVAEPGRALRDRRLGLPFELVLLTSTETLAGGGALTAELHFETRPHEGALVVAVNREDPELRLRARSDARGRVRFELPSGGAWMLHAVHMRRVEDVAPALADADWESFWASLTFELPAAESRSPADAARATAARP